MLSPAPAPPVSTQPQSITVPTTGTYYWYGEIKRGPTTRTDPRLPSRVVATGVSCYSSTDLYAWTNRGVALRVDETNPNSDISPNAVIERPKVLYSREKDEYVMWFHVDDAAYKAARLGVAVSSAGPEGPFTYLGSERPHGDQESRDFTVWQDPDPDPAMGTGTGESGEGSDGDGAGAGGGAGEEKEEGSRVTMTRRRWRQ